jgi:hypothetical protein
MTVNTVTPAVTISGTTTVNKDSAASISSVAINGGTNPLYKWQDSTGLHNWQDISGATSSSLSFKPSATGDKIRCLLTSNENCAGTAPVNSNTLVFTVNTITAINPVPGSNNVIRYYPNPASTTLTIDSLKIADQWQTLDIISTNGKNNLPSLTISNQTKVAVNIMQLSPGYYIAVLRRKQGAPVYLRFIKL